MKLHDLSIGKDVTVMLCFSIHSQHSPWEHLMGEWSLFFCKPLNAEHHIFIPILWRLPTSSKFSWIWTLDAEDKSILWNKLAIWCGSLRHRNALSSNLQSVTYYFDFLLKVHWELMSTDTIPEEKITEETELRTSRTFLSLFWIHCVENNPCQCTTNLLQAPWWQGIIVNF